MDIILYIVAAIGIGASVIFGLAFVTTFLRFRTELKAEYEQKIAEENALVRVELVKQADFTLILAYDAFTKKFVAQGETADDVVEKLSKVYSGKKSISLLSIDNRVLPLIELKGNV